MKISLFLTLFIFILASCIQAPKNARKTSTSNISNSPTNTSTSSSTPTFQSDEKLYWFSSIKTTGTITINKNNLNTYYLRGSSIHNYLNSKDSTGAYSYNKQYCLVGNFSSASYKQLRVRAVPMTSTVNNITERMLRIDFPIESDNSTACQKTTIDTILPASAAYSLKTICPTCTGKVTTSKLKLFINNLTYNRLDTIEASALSTDPILLQVDLDSNSTAENSVCTNSSCGAKGFDCCIEGQCVKDGTIKTSASSDSQYAQAMAEFTANPFTFINWPNIFNVCSNIAHSPVNTTNNSSSTAATSLATAQERVNAYLKNWYCMEDVAANSSNYARCIGKTVSGSSLAYDEVRYDLAKSCGCTVDQSLMDLKCPNWTVKPIYKNSVQTDTNIVDFYCYTPVPENQVGAITNLNVSVSARSAPHRFYSEAGDSYDSLTGLASTIKQEGDDFYYLDELNKSGPQNGSYNINSVLGKMVVDLSKTAPAKLVNVELGKTYILSATSGYFTPCPLCAKDFWFQSFFSHPPTEKGIGLSFSGYSTTRDAFGGNDTLGNYEDTHFGRACFLPVTMIPISHQKNSNLQTQRQNRLKTQAAFYINGYQRDWYGFNKGALIGSFDGVTWFAIGTGRRITATSSKLFLAFNSSFLDLATRTDTIVNIIPDSGNNTASNVDYDPDLDLKNPLQGTAATCQRFHQCVTDSECISQLGWEYVCADVSQLKTTWPLFDANGKENKNQERTGTLFDILSGTINTTYTKRCVYRGAGAPCKRDFTYFDPANNTGGNVTYKKLLTCAPNFYCASITSQKFNDEVARSPNEFDNILYGMDANVLGRPLNYVTANKSLPEEVISNIQYVAGNTSALGLGVFANDMGMCRPGKAQISSYSESKMVLAHSNADTTKRTDYISQIGSCTSTVAGDARVLGCPAIGPDNNYIDPSVNMTDEVRQQNMCGGEAKHSTTFISGFKAFEFASLASINSIPTPTMALDACLRRAGSVCHTNLDCGPNSMHESIASSLNLSYFGGTEAERSYWSESLICGQSEATPVKSATNYLTYQLNQNRCCREIGKDFTMYTKGDSTFIKDQTGTGNTLLNTTKFTIDDPTANYRYSRYVIAPAATYDPVDEIVTTNLIPQIPLSTSGTIREPNPRQWMVINETGNKTCCGGGWIRKFADGTHTWPIKSRLSIDTSNFSCLNFRSPLADSNFPSLNPTLMYSSLVTPPVATSPSSTRFVSSQAYTRESESFCRAPTDGGCMQIPYKEPRDFLISTPEPYFPGDSVTVPETAQSDAGYEEDDLSGTVFSRIDTSPSSDPSASADYYRTVNVDAPYTPIAYDNPYNFGKYQNAKTLTIFYSQTLGYSAHFYLPAYVGWDGTIANGLFINKVYIKYFYDSQSGKKPRVQDITSQVVADPARCTAALTYNSPTDLPADELLEGAETDVAKWCIASHSKSSNKPVIVVRADTSTGGTYDGWKYAGIIIDFLPIEFKKGSYTSDTPDKLTTITGTKVAIPGNPLYYITKLARLELLGIPQITYEPIYCNNNQNNLVPGLYKTSTTSPLTTRDHFQTQGYTYSGSYDPIESYNEDQSANESENYTIVAGVKKVNYGNIEKKFVYQNKIDHDPVFSSKDFTCCTPLGKVPKSGAASCCSGFAVTKSNKTTCQLPVGTDLNVYFNKFVSSEGVGSDQPGGGLIATYSRDTDGDGIDDISAEQANSNIDFNPFTGEPKLRESTSKKIFTLGVAYCSTGKVRDGSTFGSFPPEPFSGSYYPEKNANSSTDTKYELSIVDSIIDNDQSNDLIRKTYFDLGFRWNYHWYCQ